MATGSRTDVQSKASAEVAERPFEKLMDALRLRAQADGANGNFEIAANVIDKIAQATSPEDIFAANAAGPADMADYLHKNLNITDITVYKSAEKFSAGGMGTYVVMEGFMDGTGEAFLLSTGAPNVVASVFRAQTAGFLSAEKPFRCQILGRETANGTLYTVGAPS